MKNLSRRRVKITGVGPVSPAGIGRAAFLRGINESVSRVRELKQFDVKAGPFVGAEVTGFRLKDYLPGKSDRRIPRQTQFALAGATLALADAKVGADELAGAEPAIVFGSALMDPDLHNRTIEGVAAHGPRAALPLIVFDAPVAAIGSKIAEMLQTRCRTFTIQTACCAGIDAIGHGADLIATGQTDIAICGGTEAPLYFHPMLEFGMTGLSPRNANAPAIMARPFDLWRTTGVIGEGAGAFILEPESSPRPALAWLEGYSYCNDSVGAGGNGLRQTMKMALANAGRRPDEIDLIFAWAPGHELIDRVEADALCEVFGERIDRIPACSSKGAIGTAFAGGSAIQTISATLALQTGIIPPTVNWETRDPECPLNLSSRAREIGFHLAIVNAHGITGTNSTLVLRRA